MVDPSTKEEGTVDIWKVTREDIQSIEELGKQVSKAEEKQCCGQEPAIRPEISMCQHPSAGNRQPLLRPQPS